MSIIGLNGQPQQSLPYTPVALVDNQLMMLMVMTGVANGMDIDTAIVKAAEVIADVVTTDHRRMIKDIIQAKKDHHDAQARAAGTEIITDN